MFTLLASLFVASGLLGAVTLDDELIRTVNTFFNFLTIVLVVWHGRRVKREIEPKVDHVLEVVDRRRLGEADTSDDGQPRDRENDN